MGGNGGVRQATDMHAVSLTLTPAVAELWDGLPRGWERSFPMPHEHPCHSLQNPKDFCDAFPALEL